MGSSLSERAEGSAIAVWLRSRYTPAALVLSAILVVTSLALTPLRAVALASSAAIAVASAGLLVSDWLGLGRRLLLATPMLAALLLPLAAGGAAERAGLTAGRALAALTCAMSMFSLVHERELSGALRGLGLPAALGAVLSAMLRQASQVRREGRRLVLARRLRGASGGWVSARVLAALLDRTRQRADRVDLALRLRGADQGQQRPQPPKRADVPLLLMSALVAALPHLAARWALQLAAQP